ncbi:hypothetical protein PAHAL_1G108500 [Panicum hallii]|jgi:hypothetical protein|uniref:Uncharacterized protein n=1 Tax=Panicum hallii TaxID=206008 RepID=A0A2T8KUT1_9POAL|nr:hypothetical protein PAHAL_1G108500 [Panicum hallii]
MTCKGLYAKCPPFLLRALLLHQERTDRHRLESKGGCVSPPCWPRPRSSHHHLISSRHGLAPLPPTRDLRAGAASSAVSQASTHRPSSRPPCSLAEPTPGSTTAEATQGAPLPPRLLPRSGAAATLRSAALPPLLACAI